MQLECSRLLEKRLPIRDTRGKSIQVHYRSVKFGKNISLLYILFSPRSRHVFFMWGGGGCICFITAPPTGGMQEEKKAQLCWMNLSYVQS